MQARRRSNNGAIHPSKKALCLTRGYVFSVDMLRQRQQVETTRENVIEALPRIPLLTHLLAVLFGRPPQHPMCCPEGRVQNLPLYRDTGLHPDLVAQHSDVAGAFNRN